MNREGPFQTDGCTMDLDLLFHICQVMLLLQLTSDCPSGQFRCVSVQPVQCISSSRVCDSIPDCADESDESSVVCDTGNGFISSQLDLTFQSYP